MEAYWLGRAEYEVTWELQERLRRRVLAGGPEVVLLCEHPPVLTLGKSATSADVSAEATTLSAHGVAVVRTSRGGKVTYHGPGQLVLYPIVRLGPERGLVRHVEALAAAAVTVAAQFGGAATYLRERVGVFVGARKLAAIGIHVQRRVTIHGMALNVSGDAVAAFRRGWFLPCGELGGQVTSLSELGAAPNTAVDTAADPSAALQPAAVAPLLLSALCAQWSRPPPSLIATTPSLLSQTLFVE